MTEYKARQTACPETFQWVTDINGDYGLHSAGCIASDCACWVWDREETETHVGAGHCGLIR